MRIVAVVLIATGLLAAQSEPQKQLISVTSTGKAVSRADMAVVFLSVRSSAPLAADALEQNKKRVQEIQTKLTAIGYKPDQVRFTGHRFAPAGGGAYYPGRDRPTGFDVYNNLYVYIAGPDLKDLNEFNARASLLLDELSKLGASPVNMPISSYSMGGTSIVAFTLKDAAVCEKQAFADAMEKARPIAEDIARRMNVKITGIDSVVTAANLRSMAIGPVNPLEEIPFEYLSSSIDEVPVRVRVDVRYSYK